METRGKGSGKREGKGEERGDGDGKGKVFPDFIILLIKEYGKVTFLFLF